MNSRLIVSAVAAATLCAGALPASAQGRVYDRNASNNPETYQQTHPEDRSNPQLQGPARVERNDPAPGQREAGRRDRAGQDQARRDDQQRREADRRQADRRNWDHRRGHERRDHGHDYGYVVPRPYYYGAPWVYYSAPPVYYGAAPQTYYPYPPAYGGTPLVFRPGDYLPPEYRAPQFVVNDWEWRGLSAPPFGYQWVLLGPDHFALVAVSTGQILSLVVTR